MNINFQTITGQKTSQEPILSGMEAEGRVMPGPSKSNSISKPGYAATLDGSGFTDNAYAGHTRTVDDISAMAQNTDVKAQHDFMALLSNTLSEEDYGKALEDGIDLKDMNSTETVNIVDKIKSVLLESGENIIGFNDDISYEKLKKITGSDSFAMALQDSFHENDIPITNENVKDAKAATNQIRDLEGLDDSAVKFMVLNNMEPTIENIYFASHSTNGQLGSGRGYYAQEAGGYYAQKADTYEWEQLDPQIEKVIEESGLDAGSEEIKENARWMVVQGIPLNTENLKAVTKLKDISFPPEDKRLSDAVSAAIADGRKAVEGNLYDPSSNLKKAKDITEDVKSISYDGIKNTLSLGKELNIRNLVEMSGKDVSGEIEVGNEKLMEARLQLEEVRLRMTTEANKLLLDRGFSIDTAPMEDLIQKLKEALHQIGEEVAGEAIDKITDVQPENASYMLRMTVSRVSFIAEGPADIVGKMADEFDSASLYRISEEAKNLTVKFRQAGEGYEKLMTSPRADLGDNIKKAFRNVDDILKDLGKELSDENRRVIRILGYNRMEINEEHFEKTRGWDAKLQATVERLKPGAVLDLIREGKNPLSMTLQELSDNLDRGSDQQDNRRKDEEKYSRFLFKLEHGKEISEEEKASFIGIYRLFHTLKKTDYQAIGSLLKTDREMTLGNLLNATRNQKASRRGVDITVDDELGGASSRVMGSSPLIDEQISAAFRYYRSKAESVYENLEPEKLIAAAPRSNTLLPQFADDLRNASVDEELDKEYAKQELQQIRQTASQKEAEPALEEMKTVDMAVTFNNLEAMIAQRRDRRSGNLWNRLKDFEETAGLEEKLEDDDYTENYVKILGQVSDKLSEELMTQEDNYIDVRAISLLQKQLYVMERGAEGGSFEVPVEIDGDLLSMHVTLRSENNANSRMDASVQTEQYGLITLRLYKDGDDIRGMLTTTHNSDQEESEYLENVRTRLCENIADKTKDVGVDRENIAILYHTQTSLSSIGAVNTKATDGFLNEKTDTRLLLTMAKAFIEAL